jgi:hypothetical protein
MTPSNLSSFLLDSLGHDQCCQALLVSRAGTIVSSAAAAHCQPLPSSLGPIAAGAFSTSAQLDRLLGAGEPSLHLHRGLTQDLLLCPLSSGMILVAAFPAGISEDRAASFASTLNARLAAVLPQAQSHPARPLLTPETRDASLALLNQLFAHSA